MKQGDILYAKSLRFTAFAGKKEERKYNPWVDTTSNRNFLTYLIPGVGQVIGLVDFATGYQQYDDSPIGNELKFLSESDPDTVPMQLFIGGSTHPPQRKLLVEFEFGDVVGVFAGKTKYLGGVAYVQVAVEIRGYTGSGDDFPVPALVWVRLSDVSNNQDELTQLAEQGQSGNVDTKTLKEKLSKAPTSATGSGSGSDSNNGGSKTGLILGLIAGVVLIGVTIWAIVTRKKED